MIPVFYHSGEIGDLIYGLKVIKSINMGDLYSHVDLNIDYNPNIERCVFPNKPFDVKMYEFVKRLLLRQPYINKFEYGVPDRIDYNLNYFRKTIFNRSRISFADIYYEACNVEIDLNDGYIPWLECDTNSLAPITVIRTNGVNRTIPNYPWKIIVQKYKNEMVFLGTKTEYEEFIVQSGGESIQWFDSSDMLSICEVINGAKLHMGNSTSISACAEGLKKNMIFEESAKRHDFPEEYWDFRRTNRFNVYADELDTNSIMEKIELFML